MFEENEVGSALFISKRGSLTWFNVFVTNFVIVKICEGIGKTPVKRSESNPIFGQKCMLFTALEIFFQVELSYRLHDNGDILAIRVTCKDFYQMMMIKLFQYLKLVLKSFDDCLVFIHILLSMNPFSSVHLLSDFTFNLVNLSERK